MIAFYSLMKQYPEARWESERRLKQDIIYKNTRKYDHVADGVLITSNDKHIAIEVELTMKVKKGLKQIFWSYCTHKVIDEVWYYCAPDVAKKLSRLTEGYDHVKIHSL